MLPEGYQKKRCLLETFFSSSLYKDDMIYIQLFDNVYKQARIWDYFQKSKSVLLDPLSEKTLEESCLQIDQDVSVLAHDSF